MLQLTSNLASAIIKLSPLDMSVCSHRTPSAQTQKSHFVSQASEMGLCLDVCLWFLCVRVCMFVRVRVHREMRFWVSGPAFTDHLCVFWLLLQQNVCTFGGLEWTYTGSSSLTVICSLLTSPVSWPLSACVCDTDMSHTLDTCTH